MLTIIHSAKCIGIKAVPVNVEVNISSGLGIHLVGLADTAVRESLLRTITALQSIGFRIPGKKIVINLAPADMHKKGSGYDLPIALGIIASSGQIELPNLEKYLIMGELGLDASVRNIPGALPIAELASENGYSGCILPAGSAMEAVEYCGCEIFGVGSMEEVIRILSGKEDCSELSGGPQRSADRASRVGKEFHSQGCGSHFASDEHRRSHRNSQNLFRSRERDSFTGTDPQTAVQGAALQLLAIGYNRRRLRKHNAGGNILSTQRSPVHG